MNVKIAFLNGVLEEEKKSIWNNMKFLLFMDKKIKLVS